MSTSHQPRNESGATSIPYALDKVVVSYAAHSDDSERVKDAKGEGLLRAILNAVGDSPESGPLPSLLIRRSELRASMPLIAVALLRIMAKNEAYFGNRPELGRVAFELFDETFANSLYDLLQLKSSDQTFEKRSRLLTAVRDTETRIQKTIGPIHTLAAASNVRQAFMRELNTHLSELIIRPFLPAELIGPRLDELFNQVELYFAGEGRDALDDAKALGTILTDYINSAREHGFEYTHRFLLPIASMIRDLFTTHLGLNPFAQPAYIDVVDSEKHYPLHLINQQFPYYVTVANRGPGIAIDVTITLEIEPSVHPETNVVVVGELGSESTLRQIPCNVTQPTRGASGIVTVTWSHFDGTRQNVVRDIAIVAQRSDVPWDDLRQLDPYSLEPVTDEKYLAGRSEDLDKLMAIISRPNIGSAYVTGQRRVGKTSVVRTLESLLKAAPGGAIVPIYVEAGEYVVAQPEPTVNSLALHLCRNIQLYGSQIAGIPLPQFTGGLSQISPYLDQVARTTPDLKILFILDEFDRLPLAGC